MAKAIRSAAKPIKPHNGQIGRIFVHFFANYAFHTVLDSADWLTSFERKLEEIEEQADMRSALIRIDVERSESANVDALAKKLAAEPAFNQGKTSSAKRLLLAQAMFPDEAKNILKQVVTTAEGLQWLAQTEYQRQ